MPRAADFPPAFEGQPMLQGSAPMPNSPIPMPQSPQGPYGGPQGPMMGKPRPFDPSGGETIYHPQNNPSGTLLPYEVNDSGRRVEGPYGGSSPMSPQMDRGRMAQGSRGQMRPGRQSLGSVNRKGY